MDAKYLCLKLENGHTEKLTEVLCEGRLYVKTESGEVLQVSSAGVIAAIKAWISTEVQTDGTVIEHDAGGNIERIIPTGMPWLKVGDCMPGE